MFFVALAADYDGTLALHGQVDTATRRALGEVRSSGRKLILVTGRDLPDLKRAFDALDLFDLVVAENGALLFCPATQEEIPLAEPPPTALVDRLRKLGVEPLSVGRTIIATWEPNEGVVLEAIRDLNLEQHIVFNKGAVMVLPSGVNKASGLKQALNRLHLSRTMSLASAMPKTISHFSAPAAARLLSTTPCPQSRRRLILSLPITARA
jgi:HAD superfamily hydrolase (TIGR01484 family)